MNASFLEKIQESPTDWSFRFTIPDGYIYKAGQYSVLKMDMKFLDTRHGARTCSFSSSPSEPFLQYTFSMRDTGFKKTLMALEPGEPVLITPARGALTLDSAETSHVCMIAGGIGVAPFRGIMKYVSDNHLKQPKLSLIYSDKSVEELVFHQEFSSYESFMNIDYTLTREDKLDWQGRRGRIDWDMLENYEESYGDDVTYLLCGSTEMVQYVHALLQAHAVPKERIIMELFTGY